MRYFKQSSCARSVDYKSMLRSGTDYDSTIMASNQRTSRTSQ